MKTLCVYCSGIETIPSLYKEEAASFGKELVRHGFDLVYGGGRYGVMGALATSVMKEGGRVVGITTTQLSHLEEAHPNLTHLITAPTMHERKRMMAERADAFVILPGGFGTLDEFFEIVTWRQLNIHEKPIYVLNFNGFWNKLISLMNHCVQEGFAVQCQTTKCVSFFDTTLELLHDVQR